MRTSRASLVGTGNSAARARPDGARKREFDERDPHPACLRSPSGQGNPRITRKLPFHIKSLQGSPALFRSFHMHSTTSPPVRAGRPPAATKNTPSALPAGLAHASVPGSPGGSFPLSQYPPLGVAPPSPEMRAPHARSRPGACPSACARAAPPWRAHLAATPSPQHTGHLGVLPRQTDRNLQQKQLEQISPCGPLALLFHIRRSGASATVPV